MFKMMMGGEREINIKTSTVNLVLEGSFKSTTINEREKIYL